MKTRYLMLSAVALCWLGLAALQAKEVRETIEKKLAFAPGAKSRQLIVDNINGSVRIKGYSGSDVQVKIEKTISARSDAKLAEAREEIRLDMREEGDAIILFVEAPYRKGDGSINYRGWRYYGYDVNFDYDINVPFDVNLSVKTINDGEVTVQKTRGDFEIDNVNGGIEAVDIAGSGHIYALNGDVRVTFSQNPQNNCYFGSLNGEVNVAFKPNLSADLRIRTFNGDVYTDFDVSFLQPRPATHRRKNGKFVYESDKAFGARVGNGGPEFEFDGFNGDIYIAQQ